MPGLLAGAERGTERSAKGETVKQELKPKEPTGEQCQAQERFELDGNRGMYLWYPQMGGYVGKAAMVRYGGTNACLEVFVWHDGDFPFCEDGDNTSPRQIHHCAAEQFIHFGETASAFQTEIEE